MRLNRALLVLIFCLEACAGEYDYGGKSPLVEVDGSFLYKEDLKAVVSTNLTENDSSLFAKHYIRNWVEDVLLYDKAKRNISDDAKINKLVENYRKTLILHTYQQELINQKLTREISEKEIANYYEKNKFFFILEQPLIKGLFIKIPLTATELDKVRSWYKAQTRDAIEHLEKYSLRNAVNYEYFYDKWVPLSDIVDLMPLKEPALKACLMKKKYVELKDATFYYFLSVTDYLNSGEQEPYELAKKRVKSMLINQKQVDFMKTVRDDLYKDAMSKNKIINY
ncbi:peptidyl-prolyl cis-trans isomerase [uncultured Bacteroides sp.]|uniref:peptidyl-prolyl cis-trans isomerase n=1 Tax=uncultured Bacteroides sp. TaxID=162156 RepID=UPI002AA6102A|nr:peptidyl-prolyl cis-trans isomerase [uncultured Bacteroides sp.]